MTQTGSHACPCCGFLTRSEADFGTFDICPICDWEDDDIQADDPDYDGGANGISLNAARKNFQEFGAISKSSKAHTRAPFDSEKPS